MRRLLCLLLLGTAPAFAQSALDQLLAALKTAPNEETAAALEQRIRELWLNAGSPAVTLLMSRGLRDQQAGAQQEAEADFDAAIALDPGLAAAYELRAVARFQQGDYAGALRDIEETLKHEPRDFAALQDLSRIAESRHDWRGAYAAWQKAMELDPKTPGGELRLNELRRHAEGEGI